MREAVRWSPNSARLEHAVPEPAQSAKVHVLVAMVMEVVLTPAGREPAAGRARRHVKSVVDDFLKQVTNQQAD